MQIKTLSIFVASLVITLPTLAIDLLGQVESKNKQSVVAEVNGVIDLAHMETGDVVNKHDILVSIKTEDFDFDVAKKQASLSLAQADLQLKQATYQRYTELVSKKSLSENDLDIAKAEYLNAKASLELAQIELKEAKKKRNNTQVAANIEGVVVTRNAENGAWVNQGDLLYQLVNIDTLTIRLLASEHDITKLSINQPIELWSETAPENKIQSTIKRIGVEMENTTHAYPIEVEIPNADHALKPGMSIYASTDVSHNSSSNQSH